MKLYTANFGQEFVCAIGIVLGIVSLICLIPSTREFILNHWQDVFVRFVATVIGTLIGVSVAFILNFRYQEARELEAFNHELMSLLTETSKNLSAMQKLEVEYFKPNMFDADISLQVSRQVFGNPKLHKFGGQGLLFALEGYISTTQLVINLHQRKIDKFLAGTPLDFQSTKDIREKLTQAIYRVRILQDVIDFYRKEKAFQTKSWKETIADDVMKKLSTPSNFLAGYKVTTQDGRAINIEATARRGESKLLEVEIRTVPNNLGEQREVIDSLKNISNIDDAKKKTREFLESKKFTIKESVETNFNF